MYISPLDKTVQIVWEALEIEIAPFDWILQRMFQKTQVYHFSKEIACMLSAEFINLGNSAKVLLNKSSPKIQS